MSSASERRTCSISQTKVTKSVFSIRFFSYSIFWLSFFPPWASTINSELFSFLAFTLSGFHYANTELGGSLRIFLHFFLHKTEDAHLLFLQLPRLRDWVLEISSITRKAVRHAHVTENQRDSQYCLGIIEEKKKHFFPTRTEANV